MRRYETIVIVDPDVPDDQRASLMERIRDTMDQQNGLLIQVDEWGNRKLAYEIKKKVRGYYLRLEYCGTGALVSELERFFKIDDRFLKYLTVLLEKEVDLEAVKAALAAEAEAQAEAEQEKSAEKTVEAAGETEVASGKTETAQAAPAEAESTAKED